MFFWSLNVSWKMCRIQAVPFLNSKTSTCWEEEAGFKTETDSNKSSFPADSDRTASLILSHYNPPFWLKTRVYVSLSLFFDICVFVSSLFLWDEANSIKASFWRDLCRILSVIISSIQYPTFCRCFQCLWVRAWFCLYFLLIYLCLFPVISVANISG